jgi:outer membrane protein insertion porin family
MLRPRSPWFVFVLLPAFVGAQGSAPAQFEGKPIVAIRYDPPLQPLDPRDLARVQLLHTGSLLNRADVAETIQRMFATGRYSDIQVDAEPSGTGVSIRFLTREAWFIGHTQAVGSISNPPSRAQIADAAQLDLGAPFHPDLLDQARKNVQNLFTQNGLYEATVRLETLEDPVHGETNVRIVVDAGVRARYAPPLIRGDAKLSDSTIIRATGWRIFLIGKWRKVTEALTQKGIDNIGKKYQKEDRLTASVNLASITYDPEAIRARPELQIDAGPKIRVQAVEGKVSKSRMKRYVPIYQEGAVDQDLLVEGARNLRDYFQSQGYPDVDVTFRELPPEGDRQTIQYFIARGPRQKLVRVRITGNHYFDRETIRERMYLEPSSFRLRWGRFSEAFRTRDEQTIADLYKASGFRDVKVTSTLQNRVNGKPSQIGVTFQIDEGPQWLVHDLNLEGFTKEDAALLRPRLESLAGEPYSDVAVGFDRTAVLNFYFARGYRHAAFTASEKTTGANRADLTYTIRPGDQEFVRDVLISGLHATHPDLVQRSLGIHPGDPLSASRDYEAQRALYDLGVFAEIDTAIQNPDGDTRFKYVLFDFTEAHKYNMNVGIGAEIAQLGATTSDLAAPTGGTGFSPRFTGDLNRINLWGIGHTATLQTRLSSLEQRVGLSYFIPRFFNSSSRSLTASVLYDNSRDVRTFASHRDEGSIQLSQKLTKPTTALFRFAYRRVSTSDIVIPALLVPQFLQPVRIGMLSANLVQDRRDNPTDPHTGIYNTVDIGVSSSYFGSQRSFTRLLARNATYYRLSKNVVLARQLTFGVIKPFQVPAGLSAAAAVPLPERFFSGGNLSLRAFPENQAGPRDTGSPVGPGGTQTEPTGFPLGGDALLISNVELRYPLIGDNIGGVLFWDAGNVYSDFSSISFRTTQRNLQDFNYMVHAVGFGIRYRTPVGPVRVDLAYSINPPSFQGFKGTVQDLLVCNPNLPPGQLPSQCQPVTQSISHFQFFFSIGQTF